MFVGDLVLLSPVRDGAVFSGIILTSMTHKAFDVPVQEIYEKIALTELFREQHQKWVKLLNRFRGSTKTPADFESINQQVGSLSFEENCPYTQRTKVVELSVCPEHFC